MSDLSYNRYSRLSDSMERDLMQKALSEGESVQAATLARKMLAALIKGVIAVKNYIVEVTRALDEARSKDAHFSGSQW